MFIKGVARISWENNRTKTHAVCLGKTFRYQYDFDESLSRIDFGWISCSCERVNANVFGT